MLTFNVLAGFYMAIAKLSGKSADVQDIIGLQPINRLSGFAPWKSKVALAASAVFLCAKHSNTSKLWWGVQGSFRAGRVSLLTGSANPVRLTTQEICTSSGEVLNSKGVQP
ncbi:MAG: hypothetical protein WAU54_05390 [Chania sp.]